MKINKFHFEHMKNAILKVLKANPDAVSNYEHGNFARSESVKNLQTRFNFDLFYAAKLDVFAHDVLYVYVNDTHIETALKHICPLVSRRY